MRKPRWLHTDEQLLVSFYGRMDRAQLEKLFPSRSWDAIKLKAVRLGLSFYPEVHGSVEAKLAVLLEDTPVNYYWMGYLLADGSFTGSRMKLSLAVEDRCAVELFAAHVSCPNVRTENGGEVVSVSVQDKFTIPKIREKFDIRDSKTTNPPTLDWIVDEGLFLSLFVGFVDGDGSITRQSGGRSDCFLRIKNHASWQDTLSKFGHKLSVISETKVNPAKINKQGYAEIAIANRNTLRYLKRKTKELNLPVLVRKWNKLGEIYD